MNPVPAQVAEALDPVTEPPAALPVFLTPADGGGGPLGFRHFPPATVETACRFRRTGDLSLLPGLLAGLMGHFVEADIRTKLNEPDDAWRLREDLGLDSLTMIEVVMVVEEVLPVSIDEEARRFRTFGDIRQTIEAKLLGVALPPSTKWLLAD